MRKLTPKILAEVLKIKILQSSIEDLYLKAHDMGISDKLFKKATAILNKSGDLDTATHKEVLEKTANYKGLILGGLFISTVLGGSGWYFLQDFKPVEKTLTTNDLLEKKIHKSAKKLIPRPRNDITKKIEEETKTKTIGTKIKRINVIDKTTATERSNLSFIINNSKNIYRQVGSEIQFCYFKNDCESLEVDDTAVDTNSFKIINDYFSIDKNNIYYFNGIDLYTVDTENKNDFKVIWKQYATDGISIYYGHELISSDIDYFKSINNSFFQDSKYLFYHGQKVLIKDELDLSKVIIYGESYFEYDGIIYFIWQDEYNESSDLELFEVDVDNHDNFESLARNFAKNKQNVFFETERIEFKNDKGEFQTPDIKSFEVLGNNYSKDQQNIYYRTTLVKNVDYDSFKIDKNGVAKDKFGEFRNGIKRFPYTSFQKISGKIHYCLDENNCFELKKNKLIAQVDKFCNNNDIKCRILKDELEVDEASFKVLDENFAVDKNDAYLFYNGELLEMPYDLNIETFRILGGGYSTDEFDVFYKNKKIKDLGFKSFKPLGEGFYTDGKIIVYNGEKVVFERISRKILIDEFDPFNKNFIKHKDFIFALDIEQKNEDLLIYRKLRKLNGTDFRLFKKFYGYDGKFIVYKNKILPEEVDIKTFEELENGNAKDKNNLYKDGEIIKSINNEKLNTPLVEKKLIIDGNDALNAIISDFEDLGIIIRKIKSLNKSNTFIDVQKAYIQNLEVSFWYSVNQKAVTKVQILKDDKNISLEGVMSAAAMNQKIFEYLAKENIKKEEKQARINLLFTNLKKANYQISNDNIKILDNDAFYIVGSKIKYKNINIDFWYSSKQEKYTKILIYNDKIELPLGNDLYNLDEVTNLIEEQITNKIFEIDNELELNDKNIFLDENSKNTSKIEKKIELEDEKFEKIDNEIQVDLLEVEIENPKNKEEDQRNKKIENK